MQNRASWLMALLFGLLYADISLVNHYLVRTETLDLGLYTNALWDYAHFQFNHGECLNAYRENLLHDHFDLYLMIFSPLGYIFGSYTLLVVQVLALVLGGIAVYKLAFLVLNNRFSALMLQLFFYGFFGVFSAIAFDYHSNVVAAAAMPWFALYVAKKRFGVAWLLLIFIWIGKENMALWMLFVCLTFLITGWQHKNQRLQLALMSLGSAVYFIVVLQWAMPALTHNGRYAHFDYPILGKSIAEAVKNLIIHPENLKYLLMDQRTGGVEMSVSKLELWMYLALSGGVLLLLRPVYLLMLLPLFFQKLFNSREHIRGIGFQYAIEFGPSIAVALVFVIQSAFNDAMKPRVAFVLAAASCIMGFTSLDNSHKGATNVQGRFYRKEHYISKEDVAAMKDVLEMIPPNERVVASSRLLAQLAYRNYAYRWPYIEFANYVVHCNAHSVYPQKPDDYQVFIEDLKNNGGWEVLVDDGFMVLLKRKHLITDDRN
ncbi:DUF2079 domain-containing protein [bacterium]|nr:DUF2079 domain-containing protein [bacterium]